MIAWLGEFQKRRYMPVNPKASTPGYSPTAVDWLKARAETTTSADVDALNQAYRTLDDFSQSVLQMREEVWSEFTRGFRCSVCGRTAKQSEAIGYDCATEC